MNEFAVHSTKKDKIRKIHCASYNDNQFTAKATAVGNHNDDKDASVPPLKDDM
jgi:hypothetical protein